MTSSAASSIPNSESLCPAPSTTIDNPILRGSNPDPSIVRVGDDYYIATSTFEWFPGVRIHHSRDLVHWRLLGHVLTRTSQVDLRGNPRSGGVWAPCLSHDGERFWLVYTDVKAWGHGFVDAHNYLVTAPSIEGPWTDPIYLNSSGFDPSMFHDEDGRKWVVNMCWDHRPGRHPFAGILLQEYDHARGILVGEPRTIFRGSTLGRTEGPHLYRRGSWLYLVCAEGGTSWEHAVTVARATNIEGPYELAPHHPLLTAEGRPSVALQKSGHGSLVQTQNEEWYLAHLCARPALPSRRCVLGRETALQRIEWDAEGWPRLLGGGNKPSTQLSAPKLSPHPFPAEPACETFDAPVLPAHFQTLRVPSDPSWLSLVDRPGYLRLRGRESPQSLHRHSLVARRITELDFEARTTLEVRPRSFQQLAGLMCWYDDQNWAYLAVTHDENLGRCLTLLVAELGACRELLDASVPLPDDPRIGLRVRARSGQLRWQWSTGSVWQPLPAVFDLTQLSDEHTTLGMGFTGAFVGMCAHDMTGASLVADFDDFEYQA